MRQISLCFVLLFTLNFLSYGQNKITGKVVDEKSKPIINSTVSIKTGTTILRYTKTDENGSYEVSYAPSEGIHYFIEAKCFGYKTIQQTINSKQTNYFFTLPENAINLDSVTVKHKPTIIKKGDTLNYRTADFSNSTDRSIGDVLKKMPGINVSENGKITYQNQPITNLYIDGDNLLDDKYNIGTKSIPYNIVTKIQIIDHDQPIKLLQKNNLSNDVAINLVIDKKTKLNVIGNAKVGGGLPQQYDVNGDLILFKPQFKFIDNLATNNIGVDLGNDIISHNTSFDVNKAENNRPSYFISSGAPSPTSLSKSRYAFNHSFLINTNNLYKFTQEKQLKTNIHFFLDNQVQNSRYNSETFLPSDTISFNQQLANNQRSRTAYAQLNYIDNSGNHYVNNKLSLAYNPIKNITNIDGASGNLKQGLNQYLLDFSNDLKFLKTLKSGLIYNFSSYVSHITQTENLTITPGILANSLNNGLSYERLDQSIKSPGIFTNNFTSYTFKKGPFTHSYTVGFSYQKLLLNSILAKESINLVENGINDLNWSRFKGYLNPSANYKTDNLHLTLSFPLTGSFIKYKQKGTNSQRNDLLANPSFSANWTPSQRSNVRLHYAFSQSLGTVEDVYNGIILSNYRYLTTNATDLPANKSQIATLRYNFKAPISLFFVSSQITYSNTLFDRISQFKIENNVQTRNTIFLENRAQSINWITGFGKYFTSINTNIHTTAAFSSSRTPLLQNNNLFSQQNKSSTLSLQINPKISNKISLDYNSVFTTNNSDVNGTSISLFSQFRNNARINITLVKSFTAAYGLTSLTIDQTNRKQASYIFHDVFLRYKAKKIKTDFEADFTNLSNIKGYDTYYINSNTSTAASYPLPGRYLLLRAVLALN